MRRARCRSAEYPRSPTVECLREAPALNCGSPARRRICAISALRLAIQSKLSGIILLARRPHRRANPPAQKPAAKKRRLEDRRRDRQIDCETRRSPRVVLKSTLLFNSECIKTLQRHDTLAGWLGPSPAASSPSVLSPSLSSSIQRSKTTTFAFICCTKSAARACAINCFVRSVRS